MPHFDVFNGDADGLCALQQLRLAEPRESELVTGPKRDIALLERVAAHAGDTVTVLDVSLDRNRGPLLRLLERGVKLQYFDHHYAGAIPGHPALEATIDTSAGVCTSILVDRHLGGRHRAWAVVAAFGDNLENSALMLAGQLGVKGAALDQLRVLGHAINYNAYGETEADLVVPPAQLHRRMAPYADPQRFIDAEDICARLDSARKADLEHGLAVPPRAKGIWLLPDAPWSRRVSGTLANRLCSDGEKAVAVLAPTGDGYVVSVRAPDGADAFCRGFATGGGRRSAAGIDRLPGEALAEFERRFAAAFA